MRKSGVEASARNKPVGKLIGYARVSTEDQELRVQLDALHRAGCWNVWQEKRSATKGPRPELGKALADLRPGDTLVVWKLDRFARSLRELFALLDRLHEAEAGFMSLTERFDLTTAMGRAFMGMMGVFAQFEAELTGERTAAGIRAIQERGLRYGAKPKLSDKRAALLVKLFKAGETKAALSKQFGISTTSVSNYLNRAKPKRRRK